MIKTAVVDIDNTLWQFYEPFYEELLKLNRDFPPPGHWTGWDIWEGYCTIEEFYRAVNAIHFRQDSDEFKPYPEARGFLSELKKRGYHITIASHRSEEFMGQTERWLQKNGLLHDAIHLSHDKTKLFESGTDVVVDDSPYVLEKAVEHGAFAAGLLFPWNRAHSENGKFFLTTKLDEILEGILKRKSG